MTEGVSSLAQADPVAPAEETKVAEQAPPKQNPENAYKEKAASRKTVEKVLADLNAWESRSNKDVHIFYFSKLKALHAAVSLQFL